MLIISAACLVFWASGPFLLNKVVCHLKIEVYILTEPYRSLPDIPLCVPPPQFKSCCYILFVKTADCKLKMCVLLFIFCQVAYRYNTQFTNSHCRIIKLPILSMRKFKAQMILESWHLFSTSWLEFDHNGIDSGTVEHTSLLSSARSLSLLSTSGCKTTSVLFGRGVMTSCLCCLWYDRPFCPPATISLNKKSLPLVLRMKVWKKKKKETVAGGGVCVCVHVHVHVHVHVCVWEGVVCVEIQERSWYIL